MPLVVATHGAGGLAEAECEYWRRLTRDGVVLLCPRGVRTRLDGPSGYYYRTHLDLEREVAAAVGAARALLGDRLLPDIGTYVGFSQGAIMGAAMIPAHGRAFPFLVLIEGGFEYWSPKKARTFAENGGRRVVFSCGTPWCTDKSAQPAEWLRDAGVEVRIESAPHVGHTPGGEVMKQTERALPWLWEGVGAYSSLMTN